MDAGAADLQGHAGVEHRDADSAFVAAGDTHTYACCSQAAVGLCGRLDNS